MAFPRSVIRKAMWSLFGFTLLSSIATSLSISGGQTDIRPQNEAQTPLLAGSMPTQFRNFSVGFSLQSSYAAVAVILEYHDGTEETVVRTLDGDDKYRRVMAHLSLESSQHLA